jgi:site-specific DNA recombinase
MAGELIPAIGYVRVSTKEQKKEGLSAAAQAKAIREYAAFRGLHLVDVVEDLGVSAHKPLARRPSGQALLQRVERGEVAAVVALKLDRLFRNAVDCLAVVERWDQAEIAVHLVNQGGASVDSRSATGRFLLTIMAGVAEMERNMVAERTQEVLDYKAERGERIGTIPYGFRTWIDGKKLEEEPQEQRVIAFMRELRGKGESYSGIARRLNDEGVPGRGARWHTSTIVRILTRS